MCHMITCLASHCPLLYASFVAHYPCCRIIPQDCTSFHLCQVPLALSDQGGNQAAKSHLWCHGECTQVLERTYCIPHSIPHSAAPVTAAANTSVTISTCLSETQTTTHAHLPSMHSVLLERRKFRTLGLNIPYDFNDTDFSVSDDLLKSYLDSYEVVSHAWMSHRSTHSRPVNHKLFCFHEAVPQPQCSQKDRCSSGPDPPPHT